MPSVQFYGCTKQRNVLTELDTFDKSGAQVQRSLMASHCARDKTVASTDVLNSRHFAVDTINSIIYFCDNSMVRQGIACYSSVDEGFTWIGKKNIVINESQ